VEGSYHDGVSAEPQPVQITVTPGGLYLTKIDGTHVYWPFAEIRQVGDDPVRLARGTEALDADRSLLAAIADAGRPRATAAPGWTWVLAGAALVLLALVPVVHFWGLPWIAGQAASLVPVSLEEQMGRMASTSLAPPDRLCTDPRAVQAVEAIVERLRRAGPDSPYTFRVSVVDDPMVNAFAAPGGYIVVFRGLLEKAQTSEEVAGVLAHEIQHVLQRHTTKAIFRELALTALLAVIFGDASPLLASIAGSLGALRFQRGDEEQADREGMRLMEGARVDPRGLLRFLESLKDEPSLPTYFSTHPNNADRLRTLEALASAARYTPAPLPAIPKACASP